MRTVLSALVCLSIIVVAPISIVSCNKPKLFKTIATEKKVGNLSKMDYDGKYYWFGSLFGGSSFKYDLKKNRFYEFDFNRGNVLEGVFDIEIVNKQPWFGLCTFGIAIFDYQINGFRYQNMDDGLAGYNNRGEKYSKVKALTYDEFGKKVWAGTIYSGLSYYDLEKNKWFLVTEPMLKDASIISIAVNKDIVAVGTNNGLVYLDRDKNQWYSCEDTLYKTWFNYVFIDNKLIFSCLNFRDEEQERDFGKVVSYNLDTKKFEVILEVDEGADALVKYDKYLVLCSNRGLTFYNLDTKKVKYIDESYGLVSNWANYAYFDGDDLWVLTQHGISKGKIKDILRELKDID
ncbi:MAG: hypothetical protein GXY86_15785 [Firmicutes bacterium]|nr:hypothetical protein [Bacillota bacterium]